MLINTGETVDWPISFLINMFSALKGSQFYFICRVCFQGNGNDNVSNDPEDHKHVAIAILGTLIGTIAVVGSGILIWKRNTDLREVICRRVCRNRNFEQGKRLT